MSNVAQLSDLATKLAQAGRWEEAERTWHEVRRLDPANPKALFSLGVHALKRGEGAQARQLLDAARQRSPSDLLTLMTLCAACRHLGDAAGEREAIDAALTVDPYFLPGLLARGSWLERFGTRAGAGATFRNALKVAPPASHWPANLRPQLEHARDYAHRYGEDFEQFLGERLAGALSRMTGVRARRWREAAAIVAGTSRPYHSESNQLHVPRFPPIPFFDRADFPFLAELESRTDLIRAELTAALAEAQDQFVPYIGYEPGQPVNQWQELNHSQRWSSLHLWRGGQPVEENLARCPETARALAALPRVEIGGLCPNAMFSALAPKTHIPPHNGETNARVVAHLPLIVPAHCWFRVGYERREWRVGEVLVFDDTIEHEAHNDSDELRVVLIFDLWNPLLEPAEREMVQVLAAAAREFSAQS